MEHRYTLYTPAGRIRHWLLVEPGWHLAWHGPNGFTTEGTVTRSSAATMLRAWRRLERKGRYTIERRDEP